MPKPLDPFAGVFHLGTDLTLADVWTGLHSDAQMWHRSAFAVDTLSQRARIDDNTSALLQTLTACPAPRWQAFIDAQGITQIGAAALSWCEGAELSAVADFYLHGISGPSDIDHRTARIVNPKLLPESRSLTQMAEIAKNDVKTLVVMCLGHLTPIIFDVSTNWLNDLPPIVGAILLERYDPVESALDPKIISNWQAAA